MVSHVMNESLLGQRNIRVVSNDTDVLVILAHHLYSKTKDLSTEVALSIESCTCTHNVISVNEVVVQHYTIMHNMLAAHAFTGCDIVSSFSGIGKITALKKLGVFPDELKLGKQDVPFPRIIESCRQFTNLLYRDKSGENLNIVRANIFRKRIAGNRNILPKLRTFSRQW